MMDIPLQATPNQSLQVALGGQAVTLNVQQLAYGLFMDVYFGTEPVITGVICLDRNRIVRSAYLGFIGDLAFVDTQGTADPIYTGLGDRWRLVYLDADEVAALET